MSSIPLTSSQGRKCGGIKRELGERPHHAQHRLSAAEAAALYA